MDINQRLTEELKKQILAAETLVAVEDLYRPYRPKRRTRATIAKEKGLEPLAALEDGVETVSYTHLTLPTTSGWCRSRWSPYH